MTTDQDAAASLNAACPRCGGGFHCGAKDSHCACFDLKLGEALRAELKETYGGAACLCIACLVELKQRDDAAAAPARAGTSSADRVAAPPKRP